MQLIIFDIDGTLVQTNKVDGACYERALSEEFGFTDLDNNWLNYRYSTDSGIVHEIFEQRLGRGPTVEERDQLCIAFLALLEAAHAHDPACFREVPGAAIAFKRLMNQGGSAVAISTGGFRTTAKMKLRVAGIDPANAAASFADDALEREELIRLARARAADICKGALFERVVYVGDRAWDVKAARNLKLPFVGVGVDGTAEELRRAGAELIVSDFTDFDELQHQLARAKPPL